MIDDNKDNPPLHYYKSDFEKLSDSLATWKVIAISGWIAAFVIIILEMTL